MMCIVLKKIIAFIMTAVMILLPYQGAMADEHIHHHAPAIPYDDSIEKVQLSDDEWKSLLPHEQFVILRQHQTEKAFTGKYDKFYEAGVYICAACGNPLFSSESKFDSGTGWPSFYQPLNAKSIGTRDDRSYLFILRTEVHCKRCGGHLGHVFKDGPQPTGLRYCINSRALSFKPANPP